MHSNDLLVTIAIPTYNRADCYLKQAIENALNQTYANIEIIVSDNCSTDDTENVVKTFKDPRIRYIRHQTNIGANNNFNFCLEQAKGVYFHLFHDDDMIDNDFIETCIMAADYSPDIGIIRTGTRVINSENTVTQESFNKVGGLSTEDFFRGWFTYKTSLYLCSTLFNTKRLKEIGGFKSQYNLFQDVKAEVQLAARFGRVDVKDMKASFRSHLDKETTAAKIRNWCKDSKLLLDLMCNLVSDKNRKTVKKEGLKFFSRINYKLAGRGKDPLKRFTARLTVFKEFNYQYVPSGHILSATSRFLRNTPIHSGLRSIKKRCTSEMS